MQRKPINLIMFIELNNVSYDIRFIYGYHSVSFLAWNCRFLRPVKWRKYRRLFQFSDLNLTDKMWNTNKITDNCFIFDNLHIFGVHFHFVFAFLVIWLTAWIISISITNEENNENCYSTHRQQTCLFHV